MNAAPSSNPRGYNRLNPKNWPLWQKFAVMLLIAVMVPALTLIVARVSTFIQADAAAVERYVRDVNDSRLNRVETALTESVEVVNRLQRDTTYNRQVNSLLTNITTPGASSVHIFWRSRLIDSGYYREVRLLDLDGVVITNVTEDIGVPPRDGEDDSTSNAYTTVARAATPPQQTLVAFMDDGTPVIERVFTVSDARGTPIGYLVTTLNVDSVLVDSLDDTLNFVPTYSYLVYPGDVVVVPEDQQQRADDSVLVAPIESVLNGELGAEEYAVPGGTVLGVYAPVSGTSFGIITETTGARQIIPLTNFLTPINAVIILVAITGLGIGLTLVLNDLVARPIDTMRRNIADFIMGRENMDALPDDRYDEIGALARALVDLRYRSELAISELEDRIAARVRDLEATQEVSRTAARERDLQQLMTQVVALIVDVFPNIYHAQIFLVDDNEEVAVLRASTGESGRILLARGHRLGVGSQSVIGRVTGEARTMIAADTLSSDFHRPNEFLPETRAELAVPLRTGNRVIGALDVQSKSSNTFTEDQVRILEIMADQISVSLDNARLYGESVRRLEDIGQATRDRTRNAWQSFMDEQRRDQLAEQTGALTVDDLAELRQRAIDERRAIAGPTNEWGTVPIVAPIMLRDQALGVVEWQVPEDSLMQDRVLLAQELTTRLANSLENVRLLQQNQLSAERERTVSDIGAQLLGRTDIDEILQTAVREVGKALKLSDVNIRLNTDPRARAFGGNRIRTTYTNGSNGNGHKQDNGKRRGDTRPLPPQADDD